MACICQSLFMRRPSKKSWEIQLESNIYQRYFYPEASKKSAIRQAQHKAVLCNPIHFTKCRKKGIKRKVFQNLATNCDIETVVLEWDIKNRTDYVRFVSLIDIQGHYFRITRTAAQQIRSYPGAPSYIENPVRLRFDCKI